LNPKGRISHPCWPLQAWNVRKEDLGYFSLTIDGRGLSSRPTTRAVAKRIQED